MSAQDFSALREQNRIPIWWGISSIDGITPTPIQVNASTGKPKMEIGTSVMPVMSQLNGSLPRDGNRIPCIGGVSNTDNSVVIPISVNPTTGAIQAQTL